MNYVKIMIVRIFVLDYDYIIDRRIYLILSQSVQSAAGLSALKPAVNGRYEYFFNVQITIAYYFTFTVQKDILSFRDYMNEHFESAGEWTVT